MFTQEEYDRGDAIALSWHIQDVKEFDPELTDQQARQILANFADHHDGSMQAMWDDLQYHVQKFKEEN